MAEPEKQQFGDGRDNYAGAARQLSDTLQQAGQTGARQAVSNGAAALVQSGIKSGKAVSEIAAGTAAGGPWGAILSAAWSLRHTLFKISVRRNWTSRTMWRSAPMWRTLKWA